MVSASHCVGLTLPGIMEEPGSFAGKIISPIPERGPEPSRRISLAIFINDVAKINSKGQKLLSQLLKKNQYRRAGGSTSLKFDARVIVATRKDLKAEVQAEQFDDELYFMLNVVAVQIPALREHLQDIPELLRYYIDYYCSKDNYPYKNFTIAAQNRLLHYQWPGNISELKNLVQRLLILSSDDEISAEEIEVALEIEVYLAL